MARTWTEEQKEEQRKRAMELNEQKKASLINVAPEDTTPKAAQGAHTGGTVDLDSLTQQQKDAMLRELAREKGLDIKSAKPMHVEYMPRPEELYGVIPEPGWWYCPVEEHPEGWNLPGIGQFQTFEVNGYTVAKEVSKNLRVYKIPLEIYRARERKAWEKDALNRQVKQTGDDRIEEYLPARNSVTVQYSGSG